MIRRSFQLSGSYDVIKDLSDLQAVEKLIQTKTDSPVLTSFDPVHSPTAKEVDQANLFPLSPCNYNNNNGGSGPNSASSTPSSSTKRGSKRRTMLFSKDKKEKEKDKDAVDGDFGSGRSIPLKQGYLYKKSATSINKEWKKKFVTLCGDGSVVYYPNLHDYMNDVHSKAIVLKHTTVKVPGKRPPKAPQSQGGSGSRPTTPVDPSLASECSNCDSNPASLERSGSVPNGFSSSLPRTSANDMESILANIGTSMIIPNSSVVSSYSSIVYPTTPSKTDSNSMKRRNKRSKHTKSCEIDYEELEKAFASAANNATAPTLEVQPSSLKKKAGHRRVKSGSGKLDNDAEPSGWEFTIVSLEGKIWHFEAAAAQERDTWVHAIEQQILSCLQSNESNREKGRKGSTSSSDCSFDIQSIRNVEGNSHCVDCRSPNPDWASLNLGALMCIECSGVHRNLGTHLSRVRSLDLDEWPSELTAVMCSIGNQLANSIWEGKNIDSRQHPSSTSSREEKERWIRAKYESKEMLCDLPPSDFSLGEQLHEAVSKEDLPLCILLLAHCCTKDVSAASDDADGFSPLHVSCSLGNIVITQLLIWSFADVKKLDAKGRSPLWYAKSAGSKECADILRHNGCNDLGTLIAQGSDVVC